MLHVCLSLLRSRDSMDLCLEVTKLHLGRDNETLGECSFFYVISIATEIHRHRSCEVCNSGNSAMNGNRDHRFQSVTLLKGIKNE